MAVEDDIVRVCTALRGYHCLGNEVFEAAGATFVRNKTCLRRHDANFVTEVRCRTPAEVEALLAQMEVEYVAFRHRQLHLDALTPPAVAAHLSLGDISFSEQVMMALEGEPKVERRPVEIRAVDDEASWSDYAALQRADWAEACRNQGREFAPEVTDDFLRSKRCKQPPAQFWIAYQSGEPAAYFSSWAAPNGVGVLEDLFTHPDCRHRGLGSMLLVRAAADARQRGAGTIVLSALTNDTPKHMYAAMGFVPVYVQRIYNWVAGTTKRTTG